MFSKNYKIKTEKEQEVYDIILNICQVEETEVRVDPKTFEYFISLEANHYDIIVDSNGVIITNSKFSLRERFDVKFLELLKDIAAERASKDRQKVKEEILSRETIMLKEIKNNIELCEK